MSLTPETRKENFLARIAGDPGKVLEPESREEWFLKRIIDAINEMRDEPLFDFKGTVATTSLLPLTGNKKGDVWIVSSDNSEWVWMSDNSSGSLSDYEELGTVVDLSGYRSAENQDVIDMQLKNNIENAWAVESGFNPNFSSGFIAQDDGKAKASQKYARTSLWNGYGYRAKFHLESTTYQMCVAFYDATGNVSTGTGYIGCSQYTDNNVYVPANAVKFGITFRRVDQANLTDSDIAAFKSELTVLDYTDRTLTQSGVAADAKTTGNKLTDAEPYFEAKDDITVVDTASDVFDLYDALVTAYPNYITKNTLTSGNVTNYEYVLSGGNYNDNNGQRSRNSTIAKPVILLLSGVHGREKNAVMSLYTVIKVMCENDYRMQDVINAATVKVLPVGCPWGYTNNSRTNANGVNINRNFDTADWSSTGSGTDNYSGASAGDQDETKIIQNWINANLNAAFMLDFHGSGYSAELSCFLGNNNTKSVTAKERYLMAMNNIIPHWERDRKFARGSYIYSYTGGTDNGAGISTTYAVEHGLELAFTVETSMNVNNSGLNSSLTIGVGAEAHASILRGLKEYYNIVADEPYVTGDPYPGVDLTQKFALEIGQYSDEWAWITARKNADNFTGIHVNDYIPVVANGNTFKARIMCINTYKGYGDTEVGNHIDWIFEELWPTLKPINPANYNNGLIPVENVAADGTTTEFTLTKEMNSINNITMGGEGLTGWTYDATTFKITFEEAPTAGTMVVTGNGTEYPWLASDAYHFANSLAGQVPNGTGLNPAVKHVDYTQGGIYYYLPQKLKNVIIQKRMYLPKRYSATGVLSNPNAGGWADIGYIWFPTECEVYGQGVWANTACDMMGSALQYPYFAGGMNRVKKRSGSRASWWLLSAYSGASSHWCNVYYCGLASDSYASTTSVAAPVCFRT